MSPRQRLRAFEVRAPERSPLGQRTDRQVRQYPDAAGSEPTDATLEDHLDVTASRIRLNAGALDWRQGGASSGGGGGSSEVVGEVPEGEQDGQNTVFTTSSVFLPQSLKVYINGLRQAFGADGTSDYTIIEPEGAGTGAQAIGIAYPLIPSDRLMVDYSQT